MLRAWRKVLVVFFQAGVAPSLSWLTGLCHGRGRGQETGAEQKLGSVPRWPAFHSHTSATGPLMRMSACREGYWIGKERPALAAPVLARRQRLHAQALRLRCEWGRRECEGREEPRALARRDRPFRSQSGKGGSLGRAIDEARAGGSGLCPSLSGFTWYSPQPDRTRKTARLARA